MALNDSQALEWNSNITVEGFYYFKAINIQHKFSIFYFYTVIYFPCHTTQQQTTRSITPNIYTITYIYIYLLSIILLHHIVIPTCVC